MSLVKFYTLAPMADAAILSSSGIDSNFNSYNAIDWNRNTIIRPNAPTTAMYERFSLGEAKATDAIIAHIQNYKTADDPNLKMYYSANGTGWTESPSSPWDWLDTTGPLRVASHPSSGVGYYWLEIDAPAATVKTDISLWGMAKKRELPYSHQLPDEELDEFPGTTVRLFDGSIWHSPSGQRALRGLKRTWRLIGDANFAILRAVWEDSQGQRLPFVLDDGSGTLRMMKFLKAPFKRKQLDAQYYEATIELIEVPYVDSGELW